MSLHLTNILLITHGMIDVGDSKFTSPVDSLALKDTYNFKWRENV